MKRLLLVRHAKSSWANPDIKDFDRPLNNRGKKNIPVMGERLRRIGMLPKVVITSPAKRAWDTALALSSELEICEQGIIVEPEIYLAEVRTLMRVVCTFDAEWSDVMLVGHNPGLTSYAEFLTGETITNIPTCGVCCVDFALDSWAEIAEDSGHMIYYDYPKKSQSLSLDHQSNQGGRL